MRSRTLSCLCGLLGVLALSPAPLGAQAARDVVARGVRAMGGEAGLRGLAVVTADFNAATFAIGQEETPASPARAAFATGRVITDWQGNRRVLTQELRPVAGGIQRQRRVTAGGIGLLETDGRPVPDAPTAVGGVERALRLAPERLLVSALGPGATLSSLPSREWRGAASDGVRYVAAPDTVDLYFDRTSGLLLVAEQVTDDPILGDRRTATWYTRWQDAGGVKFPRQVDVEVNGRLQSHTVYPAVTTAPTTDGGLFAIPDSIAARAQRSMPAAPPQVPQVAQLAPGVWHVTGGSHHSLVVEQPNELIVVEGPFSTQRTQAVLDTLRGRFPNKRVGLVINTHHHWDHSSGLRGYLAAGVPILTHARNADFVRRIAAAQKTVAPDALTRGGRMPQVRTVEDSLTVGEGNGRITVYATPTVHVEGLLIAYVPSARVLFNSDLAAPGPTIPSPGARELVAAVRQRGISVDWVAGGHGGPATRWADVERAAQ
ncbi:MAG: MBL fold metallo-hydrolase [Gemmatimonadetes bacterium]|nr:MBL fold metallo-hydrolase [Gemmatimonadota bacterium]